MSDGMMDRGPAVSGKKLLITVILGLILFTLVSMFATFGIGRVWGNAQNKKALDIERNIQSERMREKEVSGNH